MHVHEIPVVMPYRLDLTVSVLRRLSTNIVDRFTPEGQYVRALSGSAQPVIVRVAQIHRGRALSVTIEGDTSEEAETLGLVRRMLGTDQDLTDFNRSAARVPWLAPLVQRMRGVKPPRYPSLWEACVNSIVFQQLSLRASERNHAPLDRCLGALGGN